VEVKEEGRREVEVKVEENRMKAGWLG
jgi:hypothetical protein